MEVQRGDSMSVHHVKLLELVKIDQNNETSYLHIKLAFDQNLEFLLKIDNDTARNLIEKCDFQGEHKYRLSLNTFVDSRNVYKSSLSKTYLDISEKITFKCSIEYSHQLESIKNSPSTNALIALPFIQLNDNAINNIQQKKQTSTDIAKRYRIPLKQISVAAISIFLVVLFIYTTQSYSNKTPMLETTIANAEVKTPVTDFKTDDTQLASISKDQSNIESTQSNIPFINVQDPVTYSIPEGFVALTFDDGPSLYTKEIVNLLKKHEVGGTFFFNGVNVKSYPDSVQYVHTNGYKIGNHSLHHVNMSGLTFNEQMEEIYQSTKLIEDITNEKMTLFRPPYGEMNKFAEETIHSQHYKIVLWNNDPKDWQNRNAETIVDNVQNSKVSGAIILLHETQATIDALPKIIEYLHDQGLQIVNLQ